MKIDETIVAVITGGADGIGLCLAELLSAAGASLALVDIRQDPLDKAKARLLSKATVSTHVVDVRDRDGIAKARDEILAIHGRVNMLINSAGVFSVGAFENLTYADFDRVLNINLNGTINMCMEFFPVLKKEKEAFIINLSSVDGLIAMPNAGPYVTSKFAVTGFTRSLQMECDLTNPHIHVACVHPGFISTNIVNNNLNHLKLDTKNVPDKMRDYFSSEAVHNFQLKVASTTPMQCAEHILSGVVSKCAYIS